MQSQAKVNKEILNKNITEAELILLENGISDST